ncbi:MAG: AraC family transcriptional regulator [Lachnospiraceae bacterium]|nr:AraC family transcriptional regulator [Lachnospiraceae bacterium]
MYNSKTSDNPPIKYRQPDLKKTSTPIDIHSRTEVVDYVENSHLRIWYNFQLDRYSSHHHNAIEIIRCIENGYTVTAGQITYSMNQGDILIIPPHMLHHLLGGVKGSRFIMLIDPAPMYNFHDYQLIAPLMKHAVLITPDKNPELHNEVTKYLEKSSEYYFNHDSMWEFYTYSCIMSACAAIYHDQLSFSNDESSGKSYPKLDPNKFASLLSYINDHYMEDITLEFAAKYVGFSKFHFTRLFKLYSGMTFHDYLIHCRIQAAEELLSSNVSVTETAFRTGFHSPYVFSRTFRKETGISPSKYHNYSSSPFRD